MRKVQAIREGKVGPYREILEHIKYDRLTLPLRRLVDTGVIRLDVALMAQDAVNETEQWSGAETVELAKQLSAMTAAQRRQAGRARRRVPDTPVEDLVEASAGGGSKQIVVTMSPDEHRALQLYAKSKGISQNAAAAGLVADGLARERAATWCCQ